MTPNLRIFTGNAHPRLAQEIADYLDLELGRAEVKTFSDGEITAKLAENVRGMDAFVIQPTCTPATSNLMELLVLLHTIRLSSAKRTTAVVPYYGYSRQDRKISPRTPITAKLVADLITKAGADRVVCLDLHAGQIQGFFDIPVDNLFAMPVLLDEIRRHVPESDRIVVVSPDSGGVERARAYAKRLGGSLAIADKRREEANVAEILRIVGDVEGRTAIIVDDIVDTAGTLTECAKALHEEGANRVIAACTHPVLSGQALKQIEESRVERLIVSDSIPLRGEALSMDQLSTVSVSGLLGEAIRRIHNEESVSSLFV
ncbi:MAG: ribose-phosphate pyrophosphokinase [Myxococcales bacterium]|nr:ribose-phosphate pyrophosphokinase [Myxococcales bacterium]